jgi:hypothetical protein
MPLCKSCRIYIAQDDVYVLKWDATEQPYCKECYINAINEEVARLTEELKEKNKSRDMWRVLWEKMCHKKDLLKGTTTKG